ncbi:15889_t:CDS:2, partial [Cetraspora pellucida]
VQSTQQVEGINGIIKSTLTNRTSLCELATQLFPEIDKWLAQFLTPSALSMQRAEIEKALWYSSILISKESINTNFTQKYDGYDFFENLDNYSATSINEVADLLPVQEIWEVIRYQATNKNYVILYENGTHIYGHPVLVHKSMSTPIHLDYNILFDTMSKTLDFCHAYGVANGLCKKAISVGLEASSDAMKILNNFLKNFIRQHSKSTNQHLFTNNVQNSIQHNNELSNLDDDQDNTVFFDISTVYYLIIKRHKEAPSVKRIKSSSELQKSHSNSSKVVKNKVTSTQLCSHCKQPNYYAKTCSAAL